MATWMKKPTKARGRLLRGVYLPAAKWLTAVKVTQNLNEMEEICKYVNRNNKMTVSFFLYVLRFADLSLSFLLLWMVSAFTYVNYVILSIVRSI